MAIFIDINFYKAEFFVSDFCYRIYYSLIVFKPPTLKNRWTS